MIAPSKSLAATPPMGWNSWNMFGSNINETALRETADALVSLGLKDCGYDYFVIDDCWSKKDGRDSHGDLLPDPEKFPDGMRALVDHIHDKGFTGILGMEHGKTMKGKEGELRLIDAYRQADQW